MKVTMPTISDPGSFVYDETHPTKYTEGCSHAIHSLLYALSSAGFEIDDGADNYELLKTALVYPDPSDEDKSLPILKLLSNIPIKISVESVGYLEDVSVSPT